MVKTDKVQIAAFRTNDSLGSDLEINFGSYFQVNNKLKHSLPCRRTPYLCPHSSSLFLFYTAATRKHGLVDVVIRLNNGDNTTGVYRQK